MQPLGTTHVMFVTPKINCNVTANYRTKGWLLWNLPNAFKGIVKAQGKGLAGTYTGNNIFKSYNWSFEFTGFDGQNIQCIWRFVDPGLINDTNMQAKARLRVVLKPDGSYRITQLFCDGQSWAGTTFDGWDSNFNELSSLPIYIIPNGKSLSIPTDVQLAIQAAMNKLPDIVCMKPDPGLPEVCIGAETAFDRTKLAEQAAALKTQADQQTSLLSALKTQFDTTTASMSECVSGTKTETQTKTDLETQLQAALTTQKQLEDTLAILLTNFADTTAANQAALQQRTDTLAQIEATKKDILDKQNALKQLGADQATANARTAQLVGELKASSDKLAVLQQAYAAKQDSIKDPAINTYIQLKGQLATAEKKLAESRKLLQDAQVQLKTAQDLDGQINTNHVKAQELQREALQAQEEASRLQALIKLQTESRFKDKADVVFLILAVLLIAGIAVIIIKSKKPEALSNRKRRLEEF